MAMGTYRSKEQNWRNRHEKTCGHCQRTFFRARRVEPALLLRAMRAQCPQRASQADAPRGPEAETRGLRCIRPSAAE
jgi:hypothetical protein